MKLISILLAGIGLLSGFSNLKNPPAKTQNQPIIEVKNAADDTPIAAAEVQFFQNEKLAISEKADAAGKISANIPAGKYTIVCSARGFETHRILDVPVYESKAIQLVFRLNAAELEEVVVKNYREYDFGRSTYSMRSDAAGDASGEYAARREGSRGMALMKKSKPTSAPAASPAAEMAAPPPPAVKYKMDGGETPRAKSESKPASEILEMSAEPHKDMVIDYETPATDDTREPAPPSEKKPRAGLLTAGEWNDLANWQTHWRDLLADGEIEQHQRTYNCFPKNRYTVFLQNESGFPAVDAIVRLTSGSEIVWESRSDNTGKAELWANFFNEKQTAEPKNLEIEAEVNGKKIKLGAAQAQQRHTLKFECKAPKNVDIVWAVDATGSMGDEVEYLKTELLDVIGRVKNSNPDLAFRMGTVFYKDEGDDYLTKSSGLNYDIEKTVNFIKKQFAGGGGDYPEAVHAALDEVINRQSWSDEAAARICFLVLDASPHQTPEVNASLQRSILAAAKKGIRIIPVSASGIQKDTEFLMKFFGLATNGTYIFLTDHSGIGGKHLEPTTDEYKVESLNDLLVRVIGECTALKTCEGKSVVRSTIEQANWQATYFPNPASQQFTLELSTDVQQVVFYNSEGKSVKKLNSLPAGQTTVVVSDLPEGIYTMRILKDNDWVSGKLVVVRL